MCKFNILAVFLHNLYIKLDTYKMNPARLIYQKFRGLLGFITQSFFNVNFIEIIFYDQLQEAVSPSENCKTPGQLLDAQTILHPGAVILT